VSGTPKLLFVAGEGDVLHASVGSAFEIATLTMVARNDRPLLTVGGAVGYVHDQVAVKLAPFGKVQDVDSFDFEPASGAFTARRSFTEVSGGGYPDGMAIDEEDGIWVALWGGSAVHRYDRAGRLDLVVELPVSNVTACAFGGPDLGTLFITTSRQGLDPADQPDAGAVFRYDAGVHGAQQHAFAG